jgi:hypothetical protein
MEVTFNKKTRDAMRKEDNLSSKRNQQNPTLEENWSIKWVGLSLKEYFAKAG